MKTTLQPISGLDPLLSIEDLADYLGVPVATIYDWRVDGKGPCGVRVGRHVKFTQSDLLAWIEAQREHRPARRGTGGELRWVVRALPSAPFGKFTFITAPNGKVKARVRFRDDDGQLRLVQATGDTRKSAERELKLKLSRRDNYSAGSRDLSADSTFGRLVDVWLADLDLTNKLAPSTRALYERNMRQLVLPAFENFTLREINVRKVDQFIKSLTASKSYSTAKQARTVLSLAFGWAVRYDALKENPVRGIAKMHGPPSPAMALTVDQAEAIRAAVRAWRRGESLSGPKPDGQLEQIIEVMLGTSARIGEVLAIRKCDVDVTRAPATVRICGTIISPAGKPTYRQAHPKTEKSTRTVSVPSFAAEVLRERLVVVGEKPSEQGAPGVPSLHVGGQAKNNALTKPSVRPNVTTPHSTTSSMERPRSATVPDVASASPTAMVSPLNGSVVACCKPSTSKAVVAPTAACRRAASAFSESRTRSPSSMGMTRKA